MNKKGNIDTDDIFKIIGFIIFLPIILAIISLAYNMLDQFHNADYIDEINQLKQEKRDLQNSHSEEILGYSNRIENLEREKEYWKDMYNNLTEVNVTKKDFEDIKYNQRVTNNNIQNTLEQNQFFYNMTENQILNINQEIYDLKKQIQTNLTINLGLFISFSFTLISIVLLAFDLIFYRFKWTYRIITKIHKKRINKNNKKKNE